MRAASADVGYVFFSPVAAVLIYWITYMLGIVAYTDNAVRELYIVKEMNNGRSRQSGIIGN